MAIFAIGDLHLSLGVEKPMDVFHGWEDYVHRLAENWLQNIAPEDTVVLAGDTSWGMTLDQCKDDFAFLQQLPGKKLLLKGNHDYWWCTMAKMKRFLEENGFTSLSFLHNDCVCTQGVALCGTRSWMWEAGQEQDDKICNREKCRLQTSLQAAQDFSGERIVFLHYPPVWASGCAQDIVSLLHAYHVQRCYYGHLHGPSIPHAVQGMVDGIEYHLISADALQFCPVKI